MKEPSKHLPHFPCDAWGPRPLVAACRWWWAEAKSFFGDDSGFEVDSGRRIGRTSYRIPPQEVNDKKGV